MTNPKKRAEPLATRLLLGALGTLALVALTLTAVQDHLREALQAARHLGLQIPSATPSPKASPPPPEEPAAPRADRALDREGYTLVSTGALFVPPSFTSTDGSFDLLIHFHGNAQLVAESVAAARLDALLLVVNIGNGSGVYDTRYAQPAVLDYDLRRVTEAAVARGLENAHLRRLALSAWSAGYGAIVRILAHEPHVARTSAVLLCDALHSNLTDEKTRAVDTERIAPFIHFADKAANGEKLFVMTHSEIEERSYATTTETSNALLDTLGIRRTRKTDWPSRPAFPLARRVMTIERWLEQHDEALKGDLRIAGYRGTKEDDHIAHLAQMSETVLPPLIAYWARKD